jgi:ABC-2 type transport system ATP-binding protein
MPADSAVHIERLTKVYPAKRRRRDPRGGDGTTAVEDLSLDIAPGEMLGLLGPNGAGKTTTVRMICGLIAPTSGVVRVDGISVREDPAKVRARIGLLPEDAGDYRNLTLTEELDYHGGMYGLDRATVRRRSTPLLERLGLRDRADDRLKTFSRGMRRKFHLIRALLHHPRLLLLDEPTAGLDPAIVEEVWDLLKALVAEHRVTVVLCSHHLEEVERLCSRVVILRRRLLVQGTLAELSGADGRYRIELVEPPAATIVDAVGRVDGVERASADGSSLHFQLNGIAADRVVPNVVRCVVNGGGNVLSVARTGRDLRSLYRSIVTSPEPASAGGGGGGEHG